MRCDVSAARKRRNKERGGGVGWRREQGSSAQEIQSFGRGEIVETLDFFSPRAETRLHLSDLLDVEGSGLDPRDVDGLIDLIDHTLDELQRQGPHEQQLDLLFNQWCQKTTKLEPCVTLFHILLRSFCLDGHKKRAGTGRGKGMGTKERGKVKEGTCILRRCVCAAGNVIKVDDAIIGLAIEDELHE